MGYAPFLWERLRTESRPVVLYGMGDGADKALRQCGHYGIPVAAVFASDGFVRGQSFRGFPVRTLRQVEEALGEFVILLCFASHRPEVLEQIRRVGERHPLLVPDFPVRGEEIVTPAYLEEHAAEISAAESLFADDFSRRVFRDVLRYKLSGDPAPLRRCESPREETCTALLASGAGEVFVDAGAYNGDTVEEFLVRAAGRSRRIVAIEPDRRNFRKLEERVRRLGTDGVECLNLGVWSGPGEQPFDHRSGRQASLGRGGDSVPVDSIDNLLGGGPATLLKLDVEGAEREALLGAGKTIRRFRPRLAVAAYHRREDLFALPLLIESLSPGYRIFLRKHPCLPAWDLNLYCIPGAQS